MTSEMVLRFYLRADTCPADTVYLSSASLADIDIGQNQQSVTSPSSTVLDISVDLGPVDVTLCTAVESNYLCFYVRHQNETASFRDDNIVNNVQCMDMAVNKVCHPGRDTIVITLLVPTLVSLSHDFTESCSTFLSLRFDIKKQHLKLVSFASN